MTQWRKVFSWEDPNKWAWAMPNPLWHERKWGEKRWWTNVLAPENPDPFTYWTAGIGDITIGAPTDEYAENVRLITREEWERGIHGDEPDPVLG